MTAVFREQKPQKELKTIKTFAEWAEKEFFAKRRSQYARQAAAHFALIAMGAGATLEEVNEARECEKTGRAARWCSRGKAR